MRYYKKVTNILFVTILSLIVLSCGSNYKKQDNTSTLVIGSQKWMLKNLDVDPYQNGDPIPYVEDPEV